MRENRKESEERGVLRLWSGSREMFWKRWIEYCSPERLSSLKCKLRRSLCFSRKSDLIEYLVLLLKEFDENSLKTFTGWAVNKVWIKETRRLRLLSFYALLQSFALEQCFRLFYITFSWKFLEFRNWNAPKNAKTAIRTDSKLCVSIQGSCDL